MYSSVKINSLQALKNYVLVADMNFSGRTLSSGLHLLNDDMRSAGIRPRWAKVYATGPTQQDVTVGQWILVAHGRWTRGVKIEDTNGEVVIRRVDIDDILLVSNVEPTDDGMSTQVLMDSKQRW
jgi:hypothetical protein